MVAADGLRAGDRVLVGEHLLVVDETLAAEFSPGDRLIGVAATGQLRRVPSATARLVADAVTAACEAFVELGAAGSGVVDRFFGIAADRLADDDVCAPVLSANGADVASARARGRSTTRLELTPRMRADMVSSLRMWRDLPVQDSPEVTISHDGWTVEQWRAPLGVVGFVFEGRPNVFADATGVLKGGNSVVFRIGSDALATAVAMMESVVRPALRLAGLPEGAVVLVESAEHAAGWALFADPRLSLAVARGSGPAVAELGSIARQAGTSVSLHGTGGAWVIVADDADEARLSAVIEHSLDRKVCNTANVVCLPRSRAELWGPLVRAAADRAAAARGVGARFHAVGDAVGVLGSAVEIEVRRADGVSFEPAVTACDVGDLAIEHEWEENPEISVVLVESVDEAVELFAAHSPRFIASVITESEETFLGAWRRLDAPFVGDGFTRWVDGQFALLRPELGLSNWQNGRLFARGGILSGDSAYSVRLRVRQGDPFLHR
ncbi:MAG: aldehyde dehydrogenase family protein [Actinomycetota bacterium]